MLGMFKHLIAPSRNLKQMRKFGYTMALAVGLGFGVLIPLIFHLNFHVWILALGAVFGLFGFVKPLWLGYVYIPWMALAEILGFINSRIILFVVFIVVFVPISIVLRLFGHDPMTRLTKDEVQTYRVKREVAYNPKNMERPY